ncbi:MAG: hypothetical protein AAGM22_24365 [Acidobacteriota bacterium]
MTYTRKLTHQLRTFSLVAALFSGLLSLGVLPAVAQGSSLAGEDDEYVCTPALYTCFSIRDERGFIIETVYGHLQN